MHRAHGVGVRKRDRCRQQAGLPHPLQAGHLAVAVETKGRGEHRQLAGDDDGDACAHVLALDERRVPDANAFDIRDRVQQPRFEVADLDPNVAGSHGCRA